MDPNRRIKKKMIYEEKEEHLYFEENVDINNKLYSSSSVHSSTNNIAKPKWLPDAADKDSFMLSKEEEIESELTGCKITVEETDGDEEETIATFVTAAGQQLALYAVEDSEEIFAVAVYDESGEPPTNFQFLMKSDVERLIGEGAVRTVKKPTQIKKQLLTTQPPIFFSKNEISDISVNSDNKHLLTENRRIREKTTTWNEDSSIMQDPDPNLEVKHASNMTHHTDNKSSELAYLMMDNYSVKTDDHEDSEDTESEGEFIEQSTVQYIFLEADESDSDLTFDDIEATLQNIQSRSKKQALKKVARDQKRLESAKRTEYEHIVPTSTSSNATNHTSNTLAERKLNFLESREELLKTLEDSPSDSAPDNAKLDSSNDLSVEYALPEPEPTKCKVKRSRKQQLVSVDRDDSEIIIQPASLLNEEENVTVKKRGKRKKRVAAHSGHHQRHESKRLKKIKHKHVEIIEIDVDEDESALQSKNNVVEITIDDSKDKYSSDKENEIIMVGDSDEESQQSDPKVALMQCQHCSRNFRQQRALETHLRVCSKPPSNAVRFNEQKLKHTNTENQETVKKQYPCKICQMKFDVVVALARHVRSAHPQKKKRRCSKSSEEQEPGKLETAVKKEESRTPQIAMIKKVKRKNNLRPNCSWEVKKLSCTDCGRWFPSAASLRAHCLQHGTKKSEQQVRRCQVCKKLIKSRLLFIQHLKTHANAQQQTKPVTNIQKKLHTTRSVTRKITTLRKRGRPRKL